MSLVLASAGRESRPLHISVFTLSDQDSSLRLREGDGLGQGWSYGGARAVLCPLGQAC